MQTASITTREVGESELLAWRDAIGSNQSLWSPFLTPRFSQIMGAHRPDSRIVVFEDGPHVAGFLPYERDREQVGHPLGRVMNDAQGMIASEPLDCDLPAVVRNLGMREWRFDHLVPGQTPIESYRQTQHPSPVVDLRAGIDAYEATLRERKSKVLSQTGRQRRVLEREFGPVTFAWHDPDPRVLETLIRWKSQQYQRTGADDLFAAPWAVAALHDFFESDDPECAGVLSVLRAGDHLVAVHFGLRRGSVLHYWFPAYDSDFSKQSPGSVLLGDLVSACPDEGIDRFDLGRGDQSYKQRIANAAYLVAEGRVPAQGALYRAALLARHPAWVRRRVQSWRERRTS